jgi:O-antigen/teichoic acid export membrane protein
VVVSELDRKLVRGSAWLALSYGGSQIISLVIAAILAHFLRPSAFGLVALSSVAIIALTTLQESGLSLAVIQRRADVEAAAGTAFVFTVTAGIALYGAAFGVAPLLARLFSQPRLTDVLRVLALVLVVRGLGLLPGALIERELVFGRRAKGELGGTIVQALVAVPLAISGFGVWSLVAGQLAGQSVQSVTFWAVTPLRPSPRLFSFRILRELGRYGRHLTAANIVNFVEQNIDTATVGRLLGAADVGYYNVAWRLSNFPATGIGYIVGRVMFPAYATLQQDRAAFRGAFLTNVRRVALVSLPVGIGILLTARPIVVGLFGERWEPSVAPLQILAVFGLVRAFAGTTAPVLQAAGRPQLVFWLSVWHLAVLSAALFALTPPFGLRGAASAVVLAGVASLVPAYWFALRVLELPLRGLIANVERLAVCSVPLALCLLVVEVSTGGLAAGLRLALLVICGVAVYAGSALALARSELRAITTAFRSS